VMGRRNPRVEQRPDAEGQRPKAAESYGKRWTIETMFQELTETLTW